MAPSRSRFLVGGITVLALALVIGAWQLLDQHSWYARALRPKSARSSGDGFALDLVSLTRSAAGERQTSTIAPEPAPQGDDARALWQAADGPPPAIAGLANGLVRDVRHVRLDTTVIGELHVGSRVPVELPGDGHYFALVQSLNVHDNGDRSWSGHLEGYELRYPVVCTQGDVAAFVTIASPQGLFELETIDGDGVLYHDQREGLQDPSKDCEVFPN